ncbi:MAG: catalase family peroxidase [Acidobacteriota bacterium]|nr:catalase family peroxidase [Acidobacteriota bacterium]
MPLPSDETILKLAGDLVSQLDAIFGVHPGFRPAHAKGALLRGAFTPSAEGAALTRAPHLHRPSTPVTVRFSDSTGLPAIPDTDPNANPHGMAVRFHLAERVHTDIVSHSVDGFPTRNGAEFLELLRAAATSAAAMGDFLASHPAALSFVQTPKPFPVSFATEAYYGVTAFRFIDTSDAGRYIRYRIVPEAGMWSLEPSALPKKGPDYLFDEIAERVLKAPVRFSLRAQIAEDGDIVNDPTNHWPATRKIADLGRIELTEFVPRSAAEQQHVIFDPIPRVDGIEPSDDPLLELRAAAYLISGRRRRAASA